MNERTGADSMPDVAAIARHYRAIWRGCLLAGLLGLLLATPLISAALVELEAAGGGPTGAGVLREGLQTGVIPASWLAGVIVATSFVCLLCVGRFGPGRVIAGTLLLVAGAGVVAADNWPRLKADWQSGHVDIGSFYNVFETSIWMSCGLHAAVALLLLAAAKAAPRRARILSEMHSFEQLGRHRRRSNRTFRPKRLLWMVVGLAAVLITAFALQMVNLAVRFYVLGIPLDLYRDPVANRDFTIAHPIVSVIGAISELTLIALMIVLAIVILRFFWRLVVADAKRLLEDPDYRPIVFLRSFSDDASTVTSKRLLDRLFLRRRRLEEIAVSALAPLGAAIAIGKPGERLPKLGAVRAYYPDAEWQAAVLEWMRRAQLIVLVGGASNWTLWELRQVIERGDYGKLVLVMPPDHDAAGRGTRWAALAKTVDGTPLEQAFRALQPEGLLAVVFKPDASLLPIKGNARLQSDYEAGLRLAVVEMLTPDSVSQNDVP